MGKLKDNKIYKFFNSISLFITNLITNSGLYCLLTKDVTRKKESNFFESILYKIISFLRMIFCKLKLDKVFDGSIFAKTELFIGLTIMLAPILPTMIDLVLVIGTFLSFILKVLLDKNFKFVYSPVNKPLNIFLCIYFVSCFFSSDIMSSLKIALLLLAFMLFYYVIINTIKTKKQLHVMIALFVVIGLLLCAYGLYQFKFGGSFASSSFVDKELFEEIQTRVSGTFDNPNVMGEYLLLVIPLTASYFFIFKGFRKKFISLMIIGFMCITLALTYSRGCYLGLIAGAGIFLLLVNIKFIFLFIAGALAIPFVMPASIMNRFTSIGNTEDSSTSYRISIWKGALAVIKDHWYKPIGQGTQAFNKIYPLYALNGVGAEHTHNLFLQIAIETSIFGLISFIFLLFRIVQTILCGIKNAIDKTTKYYMIGFISGIAGFIIQSMFDNTWYNNRIVLVLWIFIALAISAKNLSKE